MAAVVTGTGNIALRLTRRFNAPRERVFDAWTTPEALKRWWCPRGWAPEGFEVDLRPGGAYALAMRELDCPPAPIFPCPGKRITRTCACRVRRASFTSSATRPGSS
jgi:hypothetical protein